MVKSYESPPITEPETASETSQVAEATPAERLAKLESLVSFLAGKVAPHALAEHDAQYAKDNPAA
jgi:hypothetical protein